MRTLLVVTVLLCLLLACTGKADSNKRITAIRWVEWCQEEESSVIYIYCASYFVGWFGGRVMGLTESRIEHGEQEVSEDLSTEILASTSTVCLPKLTYETYMKALSKKIEQRPEWYHLDAAEALAIALQELYPCY